MSKIEASIDKETLKPTPVKFLKKSQKGKVCLRIEDQNPLCFEKYDSEPLLGEFFLMEDEEIIALGQIHKYKPISEEEHEIIYETRFKDSQFLHEETR